MQPSGGGLTPNPRLSVADAAQILRAHWGVEGALSDLGSLQDQNLRVSRGDGTRLVVKVARPGESRDELELQNAAMRYVAEHRSGFDSPEPVRALDGRDIVSHEGHYVRVLTWVDGVPLAHRQRLSHADVIELGMLAGRTTLALMGFAHPAMNRNIRWDSRWARLVVDELGDQLRDPGHRALVARALNHFDELSDLADRLPVQVVHADVTDVNAVRQPDSKGRWAVRGVLDFGDVMRTWRVGDVAATAAGIAGHVSVDDVLDAVIAALTGYRSVCALTEDEVDALWPLVLSRAAVDVVVSEIQFELNLASGYAQDSALVAVRSLERVLEVPPELANAAVRAAAGFDPRPANQDLSSWLASVPVAEIVPGVAAATTLDLSVTSESFAYGEWLDASALLEVIPASTITIGRWAESRLTDTRGPQPVPSPQVHLGADVFVACGTEVFAPVAATIEVRAEHELVLDLRPSGGDVFLRLAGLDPAPGAQVGSAVSSGGSLGTVAASQALLPPHVHIQLQTAPELPMLGTPLHRAAWQAVCPDPSGLLGPDVAAAQPLPARLRRAQREASVARPQHLYYDDPIEIVRGWRSSLYDIDGRPYLDMINNIASVGHTHPRITAAATRQFRRLNTNSRFLYDSMTTYSARISDLLPAGLDSVFLVNSGSEAADLALQLARVFTSRRDVIALAGAYHGWTAAVIDVSTSPMDRPRWREELPPYVHIAEQPDPYRGRFGADAAAYCNTVRVACAAADGAGGVAAFVSEPLLGNQGAVEPPKDFLRLAYDVVRQSGGLCIADEVQVGMARTGDHFWAFEHEGVVPDIVYTAKATGNGHPLGVVVCRDDIADAFDGRAAYFSSTGGGPVSCEIGIAVLDVIRDEGLQANAAVVGNHLRQQLVALADRHPLIGAVHGRGLYLGVDLVRDPVTKEAAREEALAISERLRGLGVIMQPTGDLFNVLKVKPPLCIDRASADYFLAALDQALAEVHEL